MLFKNEEEYYKDLFTKTKKTSKFNLVIDIKSIIDFKKSLYNTIIEDPIEGLIKNNINITDIKNDYDLLINNTQDNKVKLDSLIKYITLEGLYFTEYRKISSQIKFGIETNRYNTVLIYYKENEYNKDKIKKDIINLFGTEIFDERITLLPIKKGYELIDYLNTTYNYDEVIVSEEEYLYRIITDTRSFRLCFYYDSYYKEYNYKLEELYKIVNKMSIQIFMITEEQNLI